MDIFVYDIKNRSYRNLHPNNINDDMECALILFNRDALDILKDYYVICGYVLIDIEHHFFTPVDIQEDKVVIFEGAFNCMPFSLKQTLSEYYINNCNQNFVSSFFLEWQFIGDWNAFKKHGAFIELCNNILDSSCIINTMIKKQINVYEPTSFKELCCFVNNVFELVDIDVNNFDYTKSYKY